jgi:hypothetical protein
VPLSEQEILAEVQVTCQKGDDAWKSDDSAINEKLARQILKRKVQRLCRAFHFPFLEQVFQSSNVTNSVFPSSLVQGSISTTSSIITISSDGYSLIFDEDVLSVDSVSIGNNFAAFMHMSDIHKQKDVIKMQPESFVPAISRLNHSKGKWEASFLKSIATSEIEVICSLYPDKISKFPKDFFDVFADHTSIQLLRLDHSSNLGSLKRDIEDKLDEEEKIIKTKYLSRVEYILTNGVDGTEYNRTIGDLRYQRVK